MNLVVAEKKMLEYALFTNAGGREINEDSIGVFENNDNYCFVLCDGLGGHGMGDVASGLVRDVFEDCFSKTENVEKFLEETFTSAQKTLIEEQIEQNVPQKMKTTCVAMITDNKNVYIGHIGDSRLYVFNRGKVKTRTLDHSIPQMLVLSKEIKESEIRNHPQRNIILRVMGIEWDKPMYELMTPIPLKKCQAFLLCSDGFWELIDEKDMCHLLRKTSSPEEWVQKMAEIVKRNGINKKMDNYSAIAVWNT